MPVFSYQTIQSLSKGLYKEKGSKFLSFAYPVVSESDIKEKIAELKKTYFDARHHCFAWVLDPDKSRSRAYDDGEPNHSAGDPILGQIKSKGLTNILIVVVRYFGGTKLGVGGLVAAYKAAAEDALANASIVEYEVTAEFKLVFDYAEISNVMRLVKDFSLVIKHQDLGGCEMVVAVALKNKEALLGRIDLLEKTGHAIKVFIHGDK